MLPRLDARGPPLHVTIGRRWRRVMGNTPTPQHCDKYLTHPTSSLKSLPLLSPHNSFTPNLKHSASTNPILTHPLPTSLPVSTLNTIHHGSRTVCLPDSGSDPLPSDFVLDKRLWISWFPRFRFFGRCRNLEFTIIITTTIISHQKECASSRTQRQCLKRRSAFNSINAKFNDRDLQSADLLARLLPGSSEFALLEKGCYIGHYWIRISSIKIIYCKTENNY